MVSPLPAADVSDLDLPVEQQSPTLPYGVGIDTHKDFIQVCILYQTPTATQRIEREFQTTWDELSKAAEWVKSTLTAHRLYAEGDILRYTIESTGCYHMPVCLAFRGQPTVINPMLAGPTRRKSDVLDARMLAHHSIIALWRPSFILPENAEILRCLLAMRNEAMRNASRLINRCNNHVLRFGHTLGRDGSMADMQRRAVVEDLCQGRSPSHAGLGPAGIPQAARPIFLDTYQLYDMYKAMAARYMKLTVEYARTQHWPNEKGELDGKTTLKNLASVPGCGEICALTWLSVIHDPRRFEDKKQVAAFCGSDPSVKVSAGKVTSHIKRKGNARLHHVLKNCASQLVRKHNEPLGQWGYNLFRRHRKGSWGRAIGAVARRLAVCLWHVHRTGFEFSYEQYRFMITPEVEDMPVDDMDLHQRYKSMLKEAGMERTGDVARAFLTTLPQQKGLGHGCLTAVKEWLNEHEIRKVPQQHPQTLPTPNPQSRRSSGTASPPATKDAASSAPSQAAHVTNSPPTPPAKSRGKKSRTGS